MHDVLDRVLDVLRGGEHPRSVWEHLYPILRRGQGADPSLFIPAAVPGLRGRVQEVGAPPAVQQGAGDRHHARSDSGKGSRDGQGVHCQGGPVSRGLHHHHCS